MATAAFKLYPSAGMVSSSRIPFSSAFPIKFGYFECLVNQFVVLKTLRVQHCHTLPSMIIIIPMVTHSPTHRRHAASHLLDKICYLLIGGIRVLFP